VSNDELPRGNEPSVNCVVTSAHHSPVNPHARRNVTRIWAKHKIWIIGSIAICELVAILVTLTMKPIYDSTATIELNKGGSSLDLGMGDALSQQMSSGTESLGTDLQTETAILKGDSLALAVIQRLGLAAQAPFMIKGGMTASTKPEQGLSLEEAPQTRTRLLGIFRGNLKVAPVRGTRLIQVTYESHQAKQAAQIANAIIESYKNQYLQSHYDATTETSAWLTRQLSDLKANVEDSEKKLIDYEKVSGIISVSTVSNSSGGGSGGGFGGGSESQIHSVVIEKLDALNAELTVAEGTRIEKEAIYRIAQSGNANVIAGLGNDPLAAQSNSMVLTQGGGLSTLQQLQQQEGLLKIALAQAAPTLDVNNRHFKDLQIQMHALDLQIQEESQQIIKRAHVDFQLALETEAAIQKVFDQQQIEAGKLNEKAVQFAVLSQEAASRKKLYEDLYTKLQEANVSAGIKATNITIVDPARSQSSPTSPNQGKNLAVGLMLGVFLGLATAFAADNLDRTVSNPLEVEEITGKPVISVIPIFEDNGRTYGASRRRIGHKPILKAPLSSAVQMLSVPYSGAAEACRALRTSIMLSRAGGGPKVVLVTSCIPGEGKTTVTTNLAVAFAQHNKKVILVEADMRRPHSRHAEDTRNRTGLSNVLAGALTSQEATLHGVHVPTLDVLPAGPRPPMPSETLGSSAFDDLLQQLRLRYDVILIDSPPALLVTDAVAISSKVDAVLWIAQSGVIARPQLARAAELINRHKMPVLGFVVNRMDVDSAAYGYGNYGSYYGEETTHDL
jgi:polysaccharide biosynthesis transport protein